MLRRKAEAERKCAERREAIRKEQNEKFAKVSLLSSLLDIFHETISASSLTEPIQLDSFRDAEKRERLRKQAEKELLRQKEALDRRQAQLELNEKRKEVRLLAYFPDHF